MAPPGDAALVIVGESVCAWGQLGVLVGLWGPGGGVGVAWRELCPSRREVRPSGEQTGVGWEQGPQGLQGHCPGLSRRSGQSLPGLERRDRAEGSRVAEPSGQLGLTEME